MSRAATAPHADTATAATVAAAQEAAAELPPTRAPRGGTSGGEQKWNPAWHGDGPDSIPGSRDLGPKPDDSYRFLCYLCHVPAATLRLLIDGKAHLIPGDATRVDKIATVGCHSTNVIRHINGPIHTKNLEKYEWQSGHRVLVKNWVEGLFSGAGSRASRLRAAGAADVAVADPWDSLTEQERNKWYFGEALAFHVVPLLLGSPVGIGFFDRLRVEALNPAFAAMGLRYTSDGRVVQSHSGMKDPPATVSRFELGAGHAGRWGTNTKIQAFAAEAAEDMRDAAGKARGLAVGFDEVVQFNRKRLTIYLYAVNAAGVPTRQAFLLCIVETKCTEDAESEDAAAARIAAAVWKALTVTAGLTVDKLKKDFVAVFVDGASVNLGSKNGVAQRLTRHQYLGRSLQVVHCVPHRVALVCSTFLTEPPKTLMDTMTAEAKKINVYMRTVKEAVNQGAVASHVPSIYEKQALFADAIGVPRRKVPTLIPTRFLYIASSGRVLLEQWASLATAAERTGEHAHAFHTYGRDAFYLFLTCMLVPFFEVLDTDLCKYGQSSTAHIGSVRGVVQATRKKLVEMAGLGSDGGGGGGEGAGGTAAFAGPRFKALQHYTKYRDDGGALVKDRAGNMALYTGTDKPYPIQVYSGFGGFARAPSTGVPIPPEKLDAFVDAVKEKVAKPMVQAIIDELDGRFPDDPTMAALAVADVAHWWERKGENHAHLLTVAPIIASSYETFVNGAVAPRFSLTALEQQAPCFNEVVQSLLLNPTDTSRGSGSEEQPRRFNRAAAAAVAASASAANEEGADDEAWQAALGEALDEAAKTNEPSPPTQTDALWTRVFNDPRNQGCEEWLKFVTMSYALVLGTSDNERLHSRMKLVRTSARSKLDDEALTAALRVVLHPNKLCPRRAFSRWVPNRQEAVGDKRKRGEEI